MHIIGGYSYSNELLQTSRVVKGCRKNPIAFVSYLYADGSLRKQLMYDEILFKYGKILYFSDVFVAKFF